MRINNVWPVCSNPALLRAVNVRLGLASVAMGFTLVVMCITLPFSGSANVVLHCSREATLVKLHSPTYPESEKWKNLGASIALIEISIGLTGALTSANLYQSSGNPALDRSALASAQASRYSPKIRDCKAVSGIYFFQVDFYPNSKPTVLLLGFHKKKPAVL